MIWGGGRCEEVQTNRIYYKIIQLTPRSPPNTHPQICTRGHQQLAEAIASTAPRNQHHQNRAQQHIQPNPTPGAFLEKCNVNAQIADKVFSDDVQHQIMLLDERMQFMLVVADNEGRPEFKFKTQVSVWGCGSWGRK